MIRQLRLIFALTACLFSWTVVGAEVSKATMPGANPSFYNQEIVMTVINKSPFFISLDRYIKTSVSVSPALSFIPYEYKSFTSRVTTSKNAGVDFYYYNSTDAFSMCHFISTVYSDGVIVASAESIGNLDCTAKLTDHNHVEFTIWPVIS